jgi:single-strand DNA-binding protein
MAGYNRVIIVGNLTRDPEYKQLNSGQAVCRLGIASSRQYKNRQTGNVSQEVCFIDVDVWGSQAEVCRQYLQKGRPVLVEGRLKLDSWKDDAGQNRSKHSVTAERIVFLSSNNNAEASADTVSFEAAGSHGKAMFGSAKTSGPDEASMMFKDEPPFEDELPF